MLISYFTTLETFLSKDRFIAAHAQLFPSFLDAYNMDVCIDSSIQFVPELGLSKMLQEEQNAYVDDLSQLILEREKRKVVELINHKYITRSSDFNRFIEILRKELSFIKYEINTNNTVSRKILQQFIADFENDLNQHLVALHGIDSNEKNVLDVESELKTSQLLSIQKFVDELYHRNFIDNEDIAKTIDLLSGREIEGKINWKGEAKQFVYLFKRIKDITVYKKAFGKKIWFRLVEFFKLNGGEFKLTNLSTYADPKNKPIPELDAIFKNLSDVFLIKKDV